VKQKPVKHRRSIIRNPVIARTPLPKKLKSHDIRGNPEKALGLRCKARHRLGSALNRPG